MRAAVMVWMLVACSGDDVGDLAVDALELTTTGDGFTVDLRWDASGGDQALLGVDIDYVVTVKLYDGDDDVTDGVRDEPSRYQVFVTGEGVEGPASASTEPRVVHRYDDAELGLANLLDPVALGEAELVLTLQDLGEGKDADLAETVLSEGLGALPGSTVVQATFPITVL